MESNPPHPSRSPLYPSVLDSHPDLHSPFLSDPPSSSSASLYPSLSAAPPPIPSAPSSSYSAAAISSSLYPSVDMAELVENLFPDVDSDEEAKQQKQQPALPPVVEETLVRVPGALLHLIDAKRSVELGAGDFSVVLLRQGQNTFAVLARLGGNGGGEDLVQWPLARDEAAVKLDEAHYFFSLRVPPGSVALDGDDAEGGTADDFVLNYGLTFAVKGQEQILKELDAVLQTYSSFSVQKVEVKTKDVKAIATADQVLDASVAKEVTPSEALGPKKEMMEERSSAYWTTLAPNVEDYSSSMAKLIAKGSGKLIKGILWCGDVTVDRLKWGEDILKRRTEPNSKKEISESAIRSMKRVKRLTKMSDKVANGVLSGVLKVTGFFTSSIVNSKVGKKFFSLLPGEVALASLDGFAKICDAAEMAGKNVLRTSSVVTTSVVSHRYGDQAGEFAQEGLHAAGHAIGTAYAVFKVRKALNPKEAIKPTSVAKTAVKAAAAEAKSKKGK